jgi:lipopolysaccharide transport system permease protein
MRGVIKILKALWQYRAFILGLVARDFRAKYLNSVLGSLWAILNPLAQILVYTLIFSQIMQAKLPGIDDTLGYSVYLVAGLLGWQFFAEVLGRMQNIFLEQSNLLTKANFPRTSLPLYVVLSASINYVILMLIFIGFLIITGRAPNISIIGIIPLLIIQQTFAIGLGIFLATLNVFFRDIAHGMGIVLQFWFWLTPIVYPVQIVPEKLNWILEINPMTWIIQGYQNIFLYGSWPIWEEGTVIITIAGLFLILGYFTFVKLDKEMVDEL